MAVLAFPENIVSEYKAALARVPGITTVVGRPLRIADPDKSAGVYAVDWTPGQPGIGQPNGMLDPFDSKYMVGIQCLIKHMDEEEARAQHSVLSKSIRVMVYRDNTLRIRLPQLSETSSGVTERVLKWQVRAQRFLSNEIEGAFVFLSTLEIEVTTELGL